MTNFVALKPDDTKEKKKNRDKTEQITIRKCNEKKQRTRIDTRNNDRKRKSTW